MKVDLFTKRDKLQDTPIPIRVDVIYVWSFSIMNKVLVLTNLSLSMFY